MNLIRCRDGVFYWRLDGAKKNGKMSWGNPRDGVLKLPWHPPYMTVFIQGRTCFVGLGTSLNNQYQYG